MTFIAIRALQRRSVGNNSLPRFRQMHAMRDNYGRTSLHIAAEFADREAIASLLNRGAEVNDRDEEGHTPLFSSGLTPQQGVCTGRRDRYSGTSAARSRRKPTALGTRHNGADRGRTKPPPCDGPPC